MLLLNAGPGFAFDDERAAYVRRQSVEHALAAHRPVFAALPKPALDFEQFDIELTWDFRTGAVQGSAALTLRAQPGAAAGDVPILIESGVTAFTATVSSGPLPVSRTAIGGGFDEVDVAVSIDQADVTLQLTWSGTLACANGSELCSKGDVPFAWLDQGSGVPLLLDPAVGYTTDTAQRTWVLHTPPGFAVQLAADLVSDSEGTTEHTSVWKTQHPVALSLDSWMISGSALTLTPTLLTATPIVHAQSLQAPDVAGWAQTVLPLEDLRFGPRLSVGTAQVIVPRASSLIGTASYGMTLLNEGYDQLGPVLHEEIWAHENIHQHFAVRGYPADISVTALLTEGITTLLELDYSSRHLVGLERDLALANRIHEFELIATYKYPKADALPLVLGEPSQMPSDAYLYNAWAYFRGASTLDLLREYVGEAIFDDALNRYLDACDQGPCDTSVFQAQLDAAAGKDLSRFFSEWLLTAKRPLLKVGFVPTTDGADVTLDQDADGLLPVEVWLEKADGTVQRESWVMTGSHESRHVIATSPAPVRAVRVNPRQEGAVRVDSAVAGDIDFDGEVDGFDIIACARQVGQTLDTPTPNAGIWHTNLDFDRRCDTNLDGQVDAAEVAALAFNTLRPPP
jgi:hypothetical protein